MSRYFYDGNGRPLNRDVKLELLLEDEAAEGGQGMEIRAESVSGHADRLEKIYMTLAGAIMGRIKNDALRMRTLASGLLVYTAERHARLEPGIEAVMMPEDTVAFNYEDFFQPPTDVPELGHEHTLWVAQSLIDYDFGVQAQRRRLEARDY